MARSSIVNRNEKRKRMVESHREKRAELKKKSLDPSLSAEERDQARMKLHSLPRNGAACRVRNRCQVTGRGQGVHRKFMVSRIVLREYAHRGYIPGMTKSSW